jgi:hypothetical protein
MNDNLQYSLITEGAELFRSFLLGSGDGSVGEALMQRLADFVQAVTTRTASGSIDSRTASAVSASMINLRTIASEIATIQQYSEDTVSKLSNQIQDLTFTGDHSK